MWKLLVVYAVCAAFVVLVLGGIVDSVLPVAPEDRKPSCHTDYYLRVIPVGGYCVDTEAS